MRRPEFDEESMLTLRSERSCRTAIVIRVLIMIALLQGAASAQTSPPPPSDQQCTLSNGVATGFFGGVTASGTYTSGANPSSKITVSEPAGPYTYTFTGQADGPGWTQISQIVVFCVLSGCPPPPSIEPPGAAIFRLLDQGSGVAAISFEDTGELFTGFGTLSCVSVAPPPPSCPANSSAFRREGADASSNSNSCKCGPFNVTRSGNGGKIMFARYTPDGGMTLDDAAAACNFSGFNWQQQITNLPCPSPMMVPASSAALPANNFCKYYDTGSSPNDVYFLATPNSLTAPPAFNDLPDGGYAGSLAGYNPFPYYYPVANAVMPNQTLVLADDHDHNPLDPADASGKTHLRGVNNTTFLAMSDTPSDPCLPGSTILSFPKQLIQRALFCGALTAAPGSYLGFTTSLVGISNDGNNTPIPLDSTSFTWMTTYNGTAGGVSGLSVSAPPDPDSGVGNITLTSINGVAVPPIVPPDQIATTASGLAYSRVSQTFTGTVTITNISGTTITTPTNFQVVLAALPSGVTLVNSAGAFDQSPYVTIPAMTSLAPNQSVTVHVQFKNPSGATINFRPEFYAGSFQ
jgi:hypothetical protein